MSTKAELEKAILELRGSPSFSNFIKTLTSRRDAVVNLLVDSDPANVDVLRGEVRAYNYIIKAATTRDPHA